MRGTWTTRYRRAVAAVAAVCCLTACEQVASQAYDPPTKFDSGGKKVGLYLDGEGGAPALLDDKLLYAAGEGELRAVDVTTGSLVWRWESRWTTSAGTGSQPPVRVRVGGSWQVLAVFGGGEVEGTGTAQSHRECDLVAVDAHTGKKVWQETIRLPATEAAGTAPAPAPVLVGADDEVAIVRYGGRTHAVDVRKHEVAWKKDNLAAGALTGGVLTGVKRRGADSTGYYLVGVDASSGRVRWNGPTKWLHPEIERASPGLVAVSGTDYDDGGNLTVLLRGATGRAVDRMRLGDSTGGPDQTCRYDGRSVTVCSAYQASVGRVLFAYDTSSGKRLWKLTTTSSRKAPVLGAAFHGVVYGELQDDRGETERRVLLDARTGKDRKGDPGVVPTLVSRFGALDVTSGDSATVHRATG